MTDMLLVYITCESVEQAKEIGKDLLRMISGKMKTPDGITIDLADQHDQTLFWNGKEFSYEKIPVPGSKILSYNVPALGNGKAPSVWVNIKKGEQTLVATTLIHVIVLAATGQDTFKSPAGTSWQTPMKKLRELFPQQT